MHVLAPRCIATRDTAVAIAYTYASVSRFMYAKPATGPAGKPADPKCRQTPGGISAAFPSASSWDGILRWGHACAYTCSTHNAHLAHMPMAIHTPICMPIPARRGYGSKS